MEMFPHRVNGSFYGGFYYLDSGKAMYLAHRKRREVFQLKNAWCLDLRTLEQCKARGIETVGIVTQTAKGKFFYLTPLEDFYGPHSFAHMGDTRQRGLPLTKFKINPMVSEKYISSAVRIR